MTLGSLGERERLDGFGDIIVALADTLVTANLGVLAFPLLHKRLELGVIRLCDGLGLHLDGQLAAGGLDVLPDLHDRLFQHLDTGLLDQSGARQDVQRRRHQLDLDLGVLSVSRLGSSQSSLDGIDAVISKAGDLDIGSDFGGLGCESLADVGLELLGDGVAGELNVFPHIGVPGHVSNMYHTSRSG